MLSQAMFETKHINERVNSPWDIVGKKSDKRKSICRGDRFTFFQLKLELSGSNLYKTVLPEYMTSLLALEVLSKVGCFFYKSYVDELSLVEFNTLKSMT